MYKDKHPSIFSRQMEAIVFIILQVFFETSGVLKIGGYSRISPGFGLGIFGHVTYLDQSRGSKKSCYSLSSGSPFTRKAFLSILSSFYLVIVFGCVRRIFFFTKGVI